MTDFTVIEATPPGGGAFLTIDDTARVDVEIAATGLQGPAGPQGPKGDPGAPGGTRFVYTRDTPAAVWTIQHNLGYEPVFSTVVAGGEDVTAGVDIFHIDSNTLTITFSEPVSGKAAFL